MPQMTETTQNAQTAQATQTAQAPSSSSSDQISIAASELQVGQFLLMNGKWREVLDIETPDDELDDLRVVLNPNLPGTRFLKLNPTRPVQMRQTHD